MVAFGDWLQNADEGTYDTITCNVFVRDLTKAGFNVKHLDKDLVVMEGPVVYLSNSADFIKAVRATELELSWGIQSHKDYGDIYFVRPTRSGKLIWRK